MTEHDIIGGIVGREGGYVNHPADRGGPTKYGITARTLGAWRRLSRDATPQEVHALGQEEATDIYRVMYIEEPGFTTANIPHESVRVAVIDDGVNTGPRSAARRLQQVLGVTADGIIGPRTRAAIAAADPGPLLKQLVRARLVYYARLCQADATQLAFFAGWVDRALKFL